MARSVSVHYSSARPRMRYRTGILRGPEAWVTTIRGGSGMTQDRGSGVGGILAEEQLPDGVPELGHADLAVSVGVQPLERGPDDALIHALGRPQAGVLACLDEPVTILIHDPREPVDERAHQPLVVSPR